MRVSCVCCVCVVCVLCVCVVCVVCVCVVCVCVVCVCVVCVCVASANIQLSALIYILQFGVHLDAIGCTEVWDLGYWPLGLNV